MRIAGILLVAAGVLIFAYQGFTYKTHEKVADIGPLHITREEKHTIPLPPLMGGVALVGGIALIVLAQRR